MSRKRGNSLIIFLIALSGFLFLRMRNKANLWGPIQNSEYRKLLPYLQAQAKVESGNFSSELYQKANNIFAMKKVRKRPTTQIDDRAYLEGKVIDYSPAQFSSKLFGVYSSPGDSVKDQLEWLRYNNFPEAVTGIEDFNEELVDRGYYTADPQKYLQALESWM